MANHLPPGVGGLLVAALFAAAMSSIDTSLNSSATVTLKDLFRGQRTAGGEMKVLRGATVFWGILGTVVSLYLSTESSDLLDIWWKLSGIFAGGMLGLFLLTQIARAATNHAAITAVAIGVLVIAWLSFDNAERIPESLRSPFHAHFTVVIGTLTILLVGLLVTRLRSARGQ